MVLGLFLGEYPEDAAASLLVLGVLAAGNLSLDETGLAFAGTFRRLAGVTTAAAGATQHQPGKVGRVDAGRAVGATSRAHRERSGTYGFVA